MRLAISNESLYAKILFVAKIVVLIYQESIDARNMALPRADDRTIDGQKTFNAELHILFNVQSRGRADRKRRSVIENRARSIHVGITDQSECSGIGHIACHQSQHTRQRSAFL